MDKSNNSYSAVLYTTSTRLPGFNYIKIYPNPASVVINLSDIEQDKGSLELFDIQGQRIRIYDNQPMELSIVDLSPGVYFLKFTFSGHVKCARFIKQ